ncbi:hypothetical protein BH11PSE7_BH11PSE7_09150 [soil metagenome]
MKLFKQQGAAGLLVQQLAQQLLLVALLAGTVTQAQVAPPPAALRDELVAPLRAAQELLAEKKFPQALEQLSATDGIAGKTKVETYFVERLRAAAASGAGNTQQAATSLEAVLASGMVPGDDQVKLVDALAGAHYNLKHYRDAARWAIRSLEIGPRDENRAAMRQMAAQSLYLDSDYQGAVQQLQALQKEQIASGLPTPEAQLDMLAGSYIKLNDDAGYMQVLEQLVRGYPRADYWADLLVRLERKPGFSPRLVIDLFRLQLAANAMAEAADYLELAQLAAQADFPAEAKKVLETGFAAKVLGAGADAEKHRRYLQQVSERAAAQDGRAPATAAATAAKAGATGSDALFKAGYIEVTLGRVESGLALMQQAMDQGGLAQPDETRIRLGAAYAQAGDKARARALFDAVLKAGGADGAADLARLWSLLIAR